MNEVAKKMRDVLPQLIEELNATPNNDFYNELVSEGVEFEPLKEYNGDVIRIDRLIEFLPTEYWSWDGTEKIYLDDISAAIQKALPEISSPYGDTWKYPRPIIVDGWHRYAAARWLYSQDKLFKIHCKYGGRIDILEYLQGKTNNFNCESV